MERPAPHRTVLVPYERVVGWAERFERRHGDVGRSRDGNRVTLSAADGATAEYDDVEPPNRLGLVLVRRGGYAIGLVDGTAVTASKCGTRYVQGKTKAGGWSQKRYARRRANQASELAEAAGRAIGRVFADASPTVVYGGGDRALVEDAVAASGARFELSPRWLDVPEPRYDVLVAAVGQARSVAIGLNGLA